MVLDENYLQKYPVDSGFLEGSIHGPTLFLLYINHFPDDVIFNIVHYANDTTLYSYCDQAFVLWQELELTFELESDLRDAKDYSRIWLVDFNAGKTQLVMFDWSNKSGTINVKMDRSRLEKKNHFLKC